MDKTCFCTIVTSSHYFFAEALCQKIKKTGSKASFSILVVDGSYSKSFNRINLIDSIYTPEDLQEVEKAIGIIESYKNIDNNALRWSLKSVFLNFLLSRKGFEKVIFLDPDLFFFSNPDFLFDKLDQKNHILLSPHWRSSNPASDPDNFQLNFRDGIFNGGFIGATKKGIPALNWWAEACLYKCEKDPCNGLFVDQKYLDILHSRFEGIGVLRHKGCNIANWNQIDCKRELVGNEVLINGNTPIIFIHFTKSTIRGILSGEDPLLLGHLIEYQNTLKEVNPDYIDVFDHFDSSHWASNDSFKPSFLNKAKVFLKKIVRA